MALVPECLSIVLPGVDIMTQMDENSRSRHDHTSETMDSESIRQLLEDGELDTLRWEDDDICRCNLPLCYNMRDWFS